MRAHLPGLLRRGKKDKKAAVFDLSASLTKKETRKLAKMQAMVPYHLARCAALSPQSTPRHCPRRALGGGSPAQL